MRKLAAMAWLLGLLACGEGRDAREVTQPAPAVVPVLGIRG